MAAITNTGSEMISLEENREGDLKIQSKESKNFLIEATVVTGFETISKNEADEKLFTNAKTERGRIFFEIPTDRLKEIFQLRSVDNVFVVVKRIPNFGFSNDKQEVISKLMGLVSELDWSFALEAWHSWGSDKYTLEQLTDKSESNPMEEGAALVVKPSFRVTCNRSGKKHSFTSPEAASAFGGAINDFFHWKIDLKNFDLEVMLNIAEQGLYVCLALTKESLHRRNLHLLGPTSLRATIAYSILRLCNIQPGEIVCDPMCGGGSISLEGAVNWPDAFHVCGDNHDLARERTAKNIQALNCLLRSQGKPEITVEAFQWDVCKMPFKNHSVDVFVTDLPFGKRMGSKHDNRSLYPALLREMARVAKPKTGRAVVLTQDKMTLTKCLAHSKAWFQAKVVAVNIGGLAACVFVLRRTGYAYT